LRAEKRISASGNKQGDQTEDLGTEEATGPERGELLAQHFSTREEPGAICVHARAVALWMRKVIRWYVARAGVSAGRILQ
jgi:hypothetical protein